MASSNLIEHITERVDRLLLRHEELLRTNALLQQQVQALVHERDLLKQQHVLAQQRLDALLVRLPDHQEDQA
jgi:FtsZ-binding cell division protein ZapB